MRTLVNQSSTANLYMATNFEVKEENFGNFSVFEILIPLVKSIYLGYINSLQPIMPLLV